MSAPLVQVKDAARWFDVSPPWLERKLAGKPRVMLRAVDGVSFEIARGETLALVGESGCGKSTVARMLVGLYGLTRGDIRFDGQPLSKMSEPGGRALRKRLQMIFQDPYASLNPRWRVGRIIAEPMLTHTTMTPAERTARVGDLLKQVGLDPADQGRYPHQFSGGQRQRISIARALAVNPEFLVCDEPTSALDVSVQAQVLNLMKDLQRELGLTYLFISHNLAVVHHVADRVGVMYLGRMVEVAPRDELFARPRHPYTRMLLEAIPDIKRGGQAAHGGGRRSAQSAESAFRVYVSSPLSPCGCAVQGRGACGDVGGGVGCCLSCGAGGEDLVFLLLPGGVLEPSGVAGGGVRGATIAVRSLRSGLPLRHLRCRLRRLPSDSLGRIYTPRAPRPPPRQTALSDHDGSWGERCAWRSCLG
jgi:peptide/nickel transport system ATP-binding protein